MSTLITDENKRCDQKCYNATSAECTCVCEGANHGVGIDGVTGQINLLNQPKMQTIEKFYQDKKRKHSRELDYGVWWYDGKRHPIYRISWIEKTGELYALDQEFDGIEILAVIETEEAVEKMLKGWAEVCGRINSLSWVRRRVQS